MRDTTASESPPIVTTDLRAARERSGLTQHELAERLDGLLSRSYLAMIETGARPFPLEHAEAVEAVLADARAERDEFRRRAREILDRVAPFTELDRMRLEYERKLAEHRLVHRNDYGA